MVAASDLNNKPFKLPPDNTAHGALLKHITLNANPETFQPMNINFGLLPDINLIKNDKTKKKKYFKGREKKKIQALKALNSFNKWYKQILN